MFVVKVLLSYGVSKTDSETTAEVLVTTDSWGVSTHGTKALAGYCRRLKTGGLNSKAQPKIVKEGPSWAIIDADMALGMVGSTFAMKTAIAKALQTGIAISTVRNSCHFGAAGYYVYQASQEGMIGLAMANDWPSVVAPGSKLPVFGSNPFAFGAPGGTYPDFILDISTAIVAGGKIHLATAEGKSIPEGWLVDMEGKPTCDGKLYPNNASLTPVGGHKGYGLAAMIEILSGVLSGAALREKVGNWAGVPEIPTDHGHCFIAINPNLIVGRDSFNAGIKELIQGVKAIPTISGIDLLSIPGEIEHNKRGLAKQKGIPVAQDVIASLRIASDESGVPLPSSIS